jgi:hypothetical protein
MWYNLSMFSIYLDDVRSPPDDGYVLTKTVEDCTTLLRDNRGNVDVLSLDNDLGEPGIDKEGRAVVLWIVEQTEFCGVSFWPRMIRIHSANPVARDYMAGVIERYGCFRYDHNESAFVDDSRM